MRKLIIFTMALFTVVVLRAQESDEEAAKRAQANNPIASVTAFNLQSYYSTNLSGVENGTLNTYWLRFATPTGRVLWRASVPFTTYANKDLGIDESGMGDIDLFAAYLAVSKPTLSVGIGPSFGFPTAMDDFLGSGKWTAGLAAVVFKIFSAQLQGGGLAIWRKSFDGDADRADVDFFAYQPFFMFQAGKGLYFRTAPTWVFNLTNGTFNMPVGFGVGKVIKINKTVCNFFIEPQFSVAHFGPNQPLFQLYSSLNMQF